MKIIQLSWYVGLGTILVGCVHPDPAPKRTAIQTIFDQTKKRYAPDDHLSIYHVGLQGTGGELTLTGEVDHATAKIETLAALKRIGVNATDHISVLPEAELDEKTWGIAHLSVASGRENPDHKAEMGTQVLMGHTVRVWKQTGFWFLVQTDDGYLSWVEKGALTQCTQKQAEEWMASPRLIVTAYEERILEHPNSGSQPVSEVVMGGLVRKTGDSGDYYAVELADGRSGFLLKTAAEDYSSWKKARQATPDSIEHTARLFLGRPYLWGGNSPKGVDCSGFAKLVFLLNGIDLNRNASQQAQQGVEVPLDSQLSRLKKSDLLFFGFRGRSGGSDFVTHVGIYLGDKLFIQSSQMVRVSSLDPDSPLRDDHHSMRRLLHARRVLPEN